MSEILVNTYFSGAGLMDEGLRQGGVTLQQSFEIDPICCETLHKNFSHDVVQSDLRLKLVADENHCHVMAVTYPCDRYSNIAALHGVRTGDDLFLHFFRHLAIHQPEMYVLENVPGMLKFPVVMEAMTRLPQYYVHVICPVSSSDWLPQTRERLIIFGSRKRFAWRPPSVRRRVRLSEILERHPQIKIPPYVGRRIRGKYRDRPIITDPKCDELAPTCVAHYAKDLSTRLVKDRRFPYGCRPYTVREYARLQGVPDSFIFAGSNSAAYRQIGNGVSVPVGRWIGKEICRYFKN